MIIVDGCEYRTLDQEIFVDGRRVVSAYTNGKLVYPEREDTMVLKMVGSVDRVVEHDHVHDNPSSTQMGGHIVYYEPGKRSYREKACFSIVLRNHNYPQGDFIHQYYYNAALEYEKVAGIIPAVPCPLRNNMVQYALAYYASTNPFVPNGDGVHPLVGSESKDGYRIFYQSTRALPLVSVELLIKVDVSAAPTCPFRAEAFYLPSGGMPFVDAEGIPLIDYVEDLPKAVNGIYRFDRRKSYYTNTYNRFNWQINEKEKTRTTIKLWRPYEKEKIQIWSEFVQVRTDGHWTTGFEVPYLIKGTRNGKYTEATTTLLQRFVVANIPYTDILYSGLESKAPDWALHPLEEDLEQFG